MDLTILEDLGLTKSEIKVFLALLKIGPAKAGKVIDKSGLQNPVVHRAFHSLIEKGIITFSVTGKIKNYNTIDPSQLLWIVEEKKKRLESIIPELKRLHEKKREETKANIHQGKKAIRRLLNYMLDGGYKEFLSYGAPKKSEEVLGGFFWQGFNRRRVKEKIKTKMVFHTSLKKRAKELNKLPIMSVRTTHKEFEELVETVIVGNKVAIIIYLENPLGILIEEELAAKSYRRFFELIWKGCKL